MSDMHAPDTTDAERAGTTGGGARGFEDHECPYCDEIRRTGQALLTHIGQKHPDEVSVHD